MVDSLLRLLNNLGIFALAYADDIIILISGDDVDVLGGLMQYALDQVEAWCRSVELSVNPHKTVLVNFTNRYKTKSIAVTLFGETLKVAREVKYLGVVMDSRLLWHRHLELKRKKLTIGFWAARRAFGVRWGLKPRMVMWLYTSVLRPGLLHGAIVWWSRCLKKSAIRVLDSLQRLVLGGVTGAMRSVPLAALQILLGVPPLDRFVRATAVRTFLRIRDGLKNAGPIIDRELMEKLELMNLKSDRMAVEYNFFKPFNVDLGCREDWISRTHQRTGRGVVWYTDGSKREDGVGAAAWLSGRSIELVFSMELCTSIFLAEVRAISECVNYMLSENMSNQVITICTDSRAALGALNGVKIKSREVRRCLANLVTLSESNRVTLCWVPGHRGVTGNEKADRLANRGASRIRSTHLEVCVPDCVVRSRAKTWLQQELLEVWRNSEGMRQAKAFFGKDCPGNWTKEVWNLNRGDLRRVVGWLTGHCAVGYHLHTTGMRVNAGCRWCGAEEESTAHLVCHCPAWTTTRRRFLGDWEVEQGALRTISLYAICGLIRSISAANEKWESRGNGIVG